MKLQFTKMHGAGNDFIVIDSTEAPFTMTTNQLRFIADRHLGIGADQILIVEKARTPDTDFRYRIFNQDGGEGEMCGNGARCFARYVYDRGLTTKKKIRVETMKGIIQPELQDDGRVKVDMGAPRFRPEEIPLNTTGLSHLSRASDTLWEVKAAGYNNWVSVVSMGNPHCVVFCPRVDDVDVDFIGPRFEHAPYFPERINTEFIRVVNPSTIKMRVWERGSGETLACGTGACAAVVAAVANGLCEKGRDITVRVQGGDLVVHYTDEAVTLTGDAKLVYTGVVEY